MDLQGITLSERSQREKDKYYAISLYVDCKAKKRPHRYREHIVSCQRWLLVGKMGRECQRYKLPVLTPISHGHGMCSMLSIVINNVFHI